MRRHVVKRSRPISRVSQKVHFPLWLVLLLSLVVVFPACVNKYPDFEYVISHYDPAQAYNGITYYESHLSNSGIYALDMDGQLLWEYRFGNVFGLGFNLMHDGNVLAMPNDRPMIIDPTTSNVIWESTGNYTGHHSILETPWGTIMFLANESVIIHSEQWGDCRITADTIFEIDLDDNQIWEWHMIDHVDPTVHYPYGLCELPAPEYSDWSHCNTIKIIENYSYDGQTYPYVVLLLSRELDTFYMIDYPSGDIIWSCGQNGDFGRREPPDEPLFNKAHEIDVLSNGNYILYDNGMDRDPQVSKALEIAVDPVAGTADAVWSWTDPDELLYAPWGGDADRLPNGNTLVADVRGQPTGSGRIIEVNPAGEKVWEMGIQTLEPTSFAYSVFQFKRIPSP